MDDMYGGNEYNYENGKGGRIQYFFIILFFKRLAMQFLSLIIMPNITRIGSLFSYANDGPLSVFKLSVETSSLATGATKKSAKHHPYTQAPTETTEQPRKAGPQHPPAPGGSVISCDK
eukprot:EG_transcript_25523